MDATIRLYHKREKEQTQNFMTAFKTGNSFKNNNSIDIWFWALNRWGRKFPSREYDLRDKIN